MSILNVEVDEKFYNNKVCAISLKVKITPYLDKKHVKYPEAQIELSKFREKLMSLLELSD